MKKVTRFFIVGLMMFYVQTRSVFAQINVATGFSLLTRGISAVSKGNSNRQTKQEKLIDLSSKQEKISGTNVTMLRVKEHDIKSKAKTNIIKLQNRLDQYAIQYKNNQPIDISKNDSDLIAIQNVDENWPVEYYIGEIRAYKRYAFQQKQKMTTAPANNLSTTPVEVVKKDTVGGKL